MSRSLSSRILRAWTPTVLAGVMFASSVSIQADDTPRPASPPAAAEGTPPTEAAADPFAIPAESTPEAVANFVQGLARGFVTRGPEQQTEAATMAYLNRMDKALAELQARKLESAPATMVATFRMQVLSVLFQNEDPTANDRLTAMVKQLSASEDPELKGLGEQFALSSQLQKFDILTPEERKAIITTIAQKLQTGELNNQIVNMAQQSAMILAEVEDPKAAVAAYELFARAIEARKEERLAGLVENFRGAARLAGLVGSKIELKGTTIDGKPFDITQWKGKVVLVDFWATWCGPCIGELPNVKENYARYHSKGFEIVGVSLDDDPAELKKFLENEKIQWVTLFPTEEAERGWESPLVRHFGINGIPTVILVDREGTVVTLDARGEALGEELAKLLGPVEGATAPPPAPTQN